jgi:pyruvate/2-oxoglutarate dehydrogenase complex dihydrolipoamide dehydrogenase (E3) component
MYILIFAGAVSDNRRGIHKVMSLEKYTYNGTCTQGSCLTSKKFVSNIKLALEKVCEFII